MSDYFKHKGHELSTDGQHGFKTAPGKTLILAGSCSTATREQVRIAQKNIPSFQLDPFKVHSGELTLETLLEWVERQTENTILIYSSAEPKAVKKVQSTLGKNNIAQQLEDLLAAVAVHSKFKNIVVAGGETSGAVVEAFGLSTFLVGPSVCPGVPLVQAVDQGKLTLALKSGNFGSPNFFEEANTLIQSLGVDV